MKRYIFAILYGSMLLNLSGCKEQDKTEESEIFRTNDISLNGNEAVEEKEAESTKIHLDITETSEGESKQETKQGEMNQEEMEQGEMNQGEVNQGKNDWQSSFYGVWKVRDYKTCNVSALSEQEIQAILNTQVSYYEDHFLENGALMETENFGYEFAFYTYDELSDEYRVDLSGWQKENAEIVEGIISDLNECFGKYFFVAGQDSLWIYYEGVFFQMERAG